MSTDRSTMDLSNEGLRLLQAGDYEGAITAFTQIIEINPRSTAAHYHRADAYRRAGRASEAERDVETARALRQADEQERAQQRVKEGGRFTAKGQKVRQGTFRLLAKYGDITIGPSAITFQRGAGEPEVNIPAQSITGVEDASLTGPLGLLGSLVAALGMVVSLRAPVHIWSYFSQGKRPFDCRLKITYLDSATGRGKSVIFDAHPPVSPIIYHLLSWIPLVGQQMARDRWEEGTTAKDGWLLRAQDLQKLGESL